jgi:hypothetical protein
MGKIRMLLISKLIIYLLLNIFALSRAHAVNNGQYEFVPPLEMQPWTGRPSFATTTMLPKLRSKS